MSLIIIKDRKGTTIPKEIIEHASKRNPDGWGIMCVIENKFFIHNNFVEGKENDTTKILRAIEIAGDNPFVLFFRKVGAFEGDARRGNLQPFSLFKEKATGNEIGIVASGNFSTFREEDSQSSDAWFFIERVLRPAYRTIASSGLAKTDKLLSVEWPLTICKSQAEMEHCFVVLMDQSGRIMHFGKDNKHAHTYEWGWASENIPLYANAALKREKPTLSPPITKITAKEIHEQSALTREDTHEPSKPRDRSLDYVRAAITSKPQTAQDSLFQDWESELKAADAAEEILKNRPKGEVWPIPGADTIPQSEVAEMKMKYLGDHSKEIPSPEFIDRMLKETPSFCEQMGLTDLRDTANWTPNMLGDMIEHHKMAALSFMLELRKNLFAEMDIQAISEEEPVVEKVGATTIIRKPQVLEKASPLDFLRRFAA